MTQSPPAGYPRIIPYLLYKDGAQAIDFLIRAFGFEERMRMAAPNGMLMHAELEFGGVVVMLADVPPMDGYGSPKDLPVVHSTTLCYVDDVDAHYAKAKAAGAQILTEPTDQFYGDRTYRARDIGGHEWTFATHVRDVSPEELAKVTGGSV